MLESYFEEYKDNYFYEKRLSSFMEQQKIVQLIKKMKSSKSVFIFGDYDADGISSSVIMKKIAEKMGIKKIKTLLPSRYDGYGAKFNFIKPFLPEYDLFLTVDNGSHIEFAKEIIKNKNIQEKFFIIDHHPSSEINFNKHSFIINPNQDGSVSTCTGMIANFIYKCMCEYDKKKKIFKGEADPHAFEEIATIAAIGDMVDLNNTYNRAQIKRGFKKINNSLLLFSKMKKDDDLFSFLGFNIIPKINSVGRIAITQDINKIDFDSLFTTVKNDSKEKIEKFNEAWKALLTFDSIRKEAKNHFLSKALLKKGEKDIINCVFLENCPIGVNGLIAQGMMDATGAPSICLSKNPFEPETILGSGRGKDLKNILQKIKNERGDIPFTFGGHIEALGVQIPYNYIESFLDAVNNYKIKNNNDLQLGSNGILVESENEEVPLQEAIEKYNAANNGIPFGNDFFIPMPILEATVIREYGESGYCQVALNGLKGLSKTNTIKQLYATDNQDKVALVKVPHSAKSISFDIRLSDATNLSIKEKERPEEEGKAFKMSR